MNDFGNGRMKQKEEQIKNLNEIIKNSKLRNEELVKENYQLRKENINI